METARERTVCLNYMGGHFVAHLHPTNVAYAFATWDELAEKTVRQRTFKIWPSDDEDTLTIADDESTGADRVLNEANEANEQFRNPVAMTPEEIEEVQEEEERRTEARRRLYPELQASFDNADELIAELSSDSEYDTYIDELNKRNQPNKRWLPSSKDRAIKPPKRFGCD